MEQQLADTGRAAPGGLRERILAGAVQVIRERGTVAATTKEIARAAGVSEGSLYNHFADKSDLIAAAMGQVTGDIREAVVHLLGQAGHGSLEDNLTEFAVTAIAFYTDLLPITGQVIGDRDLIQRLRADTHADPGPGTGPIMGVVALSRYFEAEQNAGRLAPGADPPYLAAVLLGACQQHAFLTLMSGPDAVASRTGLAADPRTYARQAVRTLLSPQTTSQ